jgi:lysophospholipase L1-like esterase
MTEPTVTLSTPSSPRRRLFKVLAVALPFLVLLLLLAAGEICGRLVMYKQHGVPDKSYGLYQSDPELGATHAPHRYNSNTILNNWGFRNREDVAAFKPSGVMRVYCSGGSTTFCYNLDTDHAWPSVLQDKLRAVPGHEHDEVLNAGQICWSLCHEFVLAKRLLPQLKPDYVILFTGVNEGMSAEQFARKDPALLDRLLAEQRWGEVAKDLDQARFLKRHSALMRLWDYRLKNWFGSKLTADYHEPEIKERPNSHPSMHPYVMANLEHTLRAYLKFIRAQGATPVILRFGDNGTDAWYMRYGTRMWRDRAVEIGREEDALICDAAPAFERHPKRMDCFISSGIHVTELGADVLSDELKRILLEAALPVNK